MSEAGLVLSTWRKMTLVGGLVALVLGLVLLFWPGKTLLVVAALVGVWLIVLGVTRLADAAGGRAAGGTSRGFNALAGAIYIVAGIVVLANLEGSLRFLALLLGLIWIFSGLSEIIGGFTRVRGAGAKTVAIVVGLLNVVIGALAVFWPKITLVALAWIAALWLILLGLIQLYFAYRAGRAAKALGPHQGYDSDLDPRSTPHP